MVSSNLSLGSPKSSCCAKQPPLLPSRVSEACWGQERGALLVLALSKQGGGGQGYGTWSTPGGHEHGG